jgi:hypothetical protein
MECGNDLLLAGVGYLAINMAVWRKRRPDWNKLYLDVLSGIVIRDGRAFTPTKKKSSKQKHLAGSAHLNAPLVGPVTRIGVHATAPIRSRSDCNAHQ